MKVNEYSIFRTVVAGIAGGLAFNISMFLTFRLVGFGLNGGGFILNPNHQSSKLIAVWTTIKPLPLIVTNPLRMSIGIILIALIHSFAYRSLSIAWQESIVNRIFRFTSLIFLLTFLFWEFFTPYNLFGEPLFLIFFELFFWLIIAFAEAVAIVSVMEHNKITYHENK